MDTLRIQMQAAYGGRQKNWERIEIPESIDMKLLQKAVFLNNNIFQAQSKHI
jgi:hypothetical protein